MTIAEAATKTYDHSERFEAAFNRIHAKLKDLAQRDGAFVDLIYDTKARYSLIRKYMEDLKAFTRLRNAMVHEKWSPGFYIAEPHEDVVLKIERICSELYYPLSFCMRKFFRSEINLDAPERFVCSEIVDKAFKHIGIDLVAARSTGDVHPVDLLESPFIHKIYSTNEEKRGREA